MRRSNMFTYQLKIRLLTALILFFFFGVVGMATEVDVPRISKETLKSELGNPRLVVIDVRTMGDWQSSQWKIQGAVREDPGDVETWQNKYAKDSKIVLYCT